MSDKWFASDNIERAYGVLSAINLLAIDAKLRLLKAENPIAAGELLQARQSLLTFAGQLSKLLQKAERREGRTILGTDSWMGHLASRFRHLTAQHQATSSLSEVALDDLSSLLDAEDDLDLTTLIHYLDGLRSLIEQYSYSDMVVVFGESWS
jgi:hypothetical protein